MSKIALSLVALLFSLSLSGVQDFDEASGQTPVFTLKQGGGTGIIVLPVTSTARNTNISIAFSPVKLVVDFSSHSFQTADIAVYTMQGKRVYQKSGFNGTIFQTPLSSLASGMYCIVITTDQIRHSSNILISR